MPPERTRYLAEISESVRGYHANAAKQSRAAREAQALRVSRELFERAGKPVDGFDEVAAAKSAELGEESRRLLVAWPKTVAA